MFLAVFIASCAANAFWAPSRQRGLTGSRWSPWIIGRADRSGAIDGPRARYRLALALSVVALFAWSPRLASGQAAADLERYGQAYIDAKQRYDKALAASLYREAAEQGRLMVEYITRLWPDRKDLIGTQHLWLGIACSLGGLFDESDKNYAQALELRTQAHGRDHPLVAEVLYNASSLYRKQTRYAEAESAARRSLTIREEHFGPDHATVAASANNLAGVLFDVGRVAEAEELFRRGLAIREKLHGPNHIECVTALANLAVVYRAAGRLDEAIASDERALAIRRGRYGDTHALTAYCRNNLAVSYAAVGRYAEAVRLYEDALAVRTQLLGVEHLDTLTTMNNLAVAYGQQNRVPEALALQQRVLEIKRQLLGDEHPSIAVALANIATLLASSGQHAAALEYRNQSLERFAAAFGVEHPNYAFGLMNRGRQHDMMAEYASAIADLNEAARLLQAHYGPEHPDVASARAYLAQAYLAVDRAADAGDLLDEVIAIHDAVGVAPGLRCMAYYWRAQARRKLADLPGAENDLLQAMRLAEQQRTDIAGGAEGRAQAFSQYRFCYDAMIALQAEAGNVAKAFDAAERGRARSLTDQMAVAHIDLLAGLPDDAAHRLRQREREAQLQLTQLEQLLQRMPEVDQLSAEERESRERLRSQLADARRELVAAYLAIRDASPAYRRILGEESELATIDAIQRSVVGQRGLLLEYSLGTNESFVIAVPPAGAEPTLHRLEVNESQASRLGVEPGPLTAEKLNRALVRDDAGGVLRSLGHPMAAIEATDQLAALWELLIPKELATVITSGNLERLYLAPDGVLNLLPFESLVVERGDDPQYLLDVGPPVSYGPSASLLRSLKQGGEAVPSDRKPVLTVGDPAYHAAATSDDSQAFATRGFDGGSLAPLPFSGRESRWVSEVFQRQGIAAGRLTGHDATEAQVRFNVAGRRIVHLACHGLADDRWGNFFGALALAPGDRQSASADDGFLTLPEIYELDLQGCELAILSACNTNYGPNLIGEGVWALSRGFLVAGSRRIVASNWLVDDEAAASLISVFCGGIAQEQGAGDSVDYAASLHAAKSWVRRQEKWRSPYYWATFVLLGPE